MTAIHAAGYRMLVAALVEARKKAGLHQADVAKVLNRPQAYVSRVETCERRLDVLEFAEFARAIGVDPVPLFAEFVERHFSSLARK